MNDYIRKFFVVLMQPSWFVLFFVACFLIMFLSHIGSIKGEEPSFEEKRATIVENIEKYQLQLEELEGLVIE